MQPERLGKVRNDTKVNLILSALELFAEHGIDAVSMRTINNAAGTRNASAVHYHFGNKLGIVEAIIQFIKDELDTYRMDAVVELERRAATGDHPSCREILWATFTPYYRLYRHPEFGKSALKFLSRLQLDVSPEMLAVLNKEPQKLMLRIDALLAQALPNLPTDIRRLRYVYFWNLTVMMFSGSEALATTGLGDVRPATDEEGLLRLFDYLVGGMESSVSIPN